MLSIYPACFYEEENGYCVIFPDLNCSTCGDSFEEAMKYAIDCLAGYIYSEWQDGTTVPTPSNLSNINPEAIAKELDFTYKNVIVTMVSVDVEAYAKEHFEKSVKKTLTIPIWLNNLALKNNVNFSQVLQEALIQKLLG